MFGNSMLSDFSPGQNSEGMFVVRPHFDTKRYKELHTFKCVFANRVFNAICVVHFASNHVLFKMELPLCS
jgi:hypothetical protein